MDENSQKSSSSSQMSESKDSFESIPEIQPQNEIKQDEKEDQQPIEPITQKPKKIRWDLLQISQKNDNILRKSIRMAKSILRKSIRAQNIQRKSIFTTQKISIIKYEPTQVEEQNEQIRRNRCKTLSPISKQKKDTSQQDKQMIRQKSFPIVMPENDFDSSDSEDSYEDYDSENDSDLESQENQQNKQNKKEQQQINFLTQKLTQQIQDSFIQSEQQLTLKKQSTLKFDNSTPSNSNQKSCVQFSAEKKQNKRKFSYQKAIELLNIEDVDIKNQEHSEFALELLNKRKKKTMLEKKFLIKILNCCSIFQKNKNLMQTESQSQKILELFSYQFMPKNTIVFNQGNHLFHSIYVELKLLNNNIIGEYGNTYYIVLAGQCMCMIPDPDYKSKEKFIPDHLSKRKMFFLENQYTKVDDQPQKEKQQKSILARDNSQIIFQLFNKNISLKDTFDFSSKKNDKDLLSLLPECFPLLKLVHVFKSGESFGDIALITNDKRTATLVCKEDTHFLTLTKEGYEKIIGGYEARLLEETIGFLRQFSYFKHIVRSRLLQILCWMKEQHFQGEQSNAVYFIRSGEIEISQATDMSNDQSADQSKQTESNGYSAKESDKILELNSVKRKKLRRMNTKKISLAILGADQYFGQDEVLDNAPLRLQTAQCISQTAHVYMLSKQKFTDMIRLNHTSIEKIKKEEKMKFNWKQERLQIISETRQQSRKNLKNIYLNDSKDPCFIEFSSPTSSKSQNNNYDGNSPNFGNQTSTSFNCIEDDTFKLNKFGYHDQIIESEQISNQQGKQMVYTKNKTIILKKSNTKCSDQINNSQTQVDSEQQILNFLEQKKEQAQKDFEILSPVKPQKNTLLYSKQPYNSQSSRMLLQNILSQPQSQIISNEVLKGDVSEKQKDDDYRFKRFQSNILLENLNSNEQKQNITYHFNTSFHSPKNIPQKYTLNPIQNKFQKPSQLQKNFQNTSSNNFNNTSYNLQSPNQQINNQSVISSNSFQECISPQNSSHSDYLRMVHQSLAAKQGVLEKLKSQTYQSSAINQNKQIFGSTLSQGENTNNFSMHIQEDTKIKQLNNLKYNLSYHTPQHKPNKLVSTPKVFTLRNLKSRNSQNKINISSEREVSNSINSQIIQKQTDEQIVKDTTEINNFSVLVNQNSIQTQSYKQIPLPQLQNDESLNQNILQPLYLKPTMSLPQSPQKQKISYNNFSIKKNENMKLQIEQTFNNEQEGKDLQNGVSKLKRVSQFEKTQISQRLSKTQDTLKQDILNKQFDSNNSILNKDDNQKSSQFIGNKYFLSPNIKNQTQNMNQTLDELKQNTSLKETARNQAVLSRGRYGNSLESVIKTTKYISNSQSFTNSSTIQNIQSPKNDQRIQLVDMINQKQQKNRNIIDDIVEKQNSINNKAIQNTKKNSIIDNKFISVNTPNNKQTQNKPNGLSNDIQNFMEFGKIGKFLKLDKLFRNNNEKLLFKQLVDQQQVKVQQIGTNRINQSQQSLIKHFLEKPAAAEQYPSIDSPMNLKFKKQNISNSQIQNSS